MAFILRSVKSLFNCCRVQFHNVLRGCASYLPAFNLSSIQFGTTATIEKQITGSNAKKGQPKVNMGKNHKKKKSSRAKTANMSSKQQIGVKRPPASPQETVSPKRMSPPISTAAVETSSESPTTSTQASKQATEQPEYQQQDGPNASLPACEMKDVEAKQSESSAERVEPEIFSSELPSTESSSNNVIKKLGKKKGKKDSQETYEVNSKPLVEKQHEPQQTKQEATPEPKLKVSPTKQKPGGEQTNDRQPKQGGRKDNEPEQRHLKDKDVRGDSNDKGPNQPNKKNQHVQQLERKASIPDSTSDDVAQSDIKPIETSPKQPTFKQPNATTPEKTTPKSKKQTQQKHPQEAKDVAINSTLLDNILHSPEKSKSAEKGKLEDERSLRQEEVTVENVSLQKRDQTQITKRSSREKSDERPPRQKSSDRPSREKSDERPPRKKSSDRPSKDKLSDQSSKEKSDDGTSPKTSKGRHSAEHGNENRNISHEKQHIPSRQTKTQRDVGQGKEQKPPKDEGNWDDDDRHTEDDGEWQRGGRDRKHDQHRDPEKEYESQHNKGDYREQGRRGGARDGRGRDGDDRPQHDRGIGRGRLQGNRRGDRGGYQNNWRGDRGGHQDGQREYHQADQMGGYEANHRGNRGGNQNNWRDNRGGYQGGQREYYQGGYDGNQRGNRGGQRGNRGGQRGGRVVIPEVPLRQPNELPSFIREVEDDLFSCENHVSLVHCVSADFVMGKGIAVDFKNRFRGVSELYSQGKGPGDVAFLKRDLRYVYYMVTKSEYYKKPSYESMRSSLVALKTLVQQHKVTELAMPRIGSGLDLLDWNEVLDMIVEVFEGSNVDITVYVYKPPRK